MNKRTIGILASVIGSAVTAWWWARQRAALANRQLTPARERGSVIFNNTPTVASEDII